MGGHVELCSRLREFLYEGECLGCVEAFVNVLPADLRGRFLSEVAAIWSTYRGFGSCRPLLGACLRAWWLFCGTDGANAAVVQEQLHAVRLRAVPDEVRLADLQLDVSSWGPARPIDAWRGLGGRGAPWGTSAYLRSAMQRWTSDAVRDLSVPESQVYVVLAIAENALDVTPIGVVEVDGEYSQGEACYAAYLQPGSRTYRAYHRRKGIGLLERLISAVVGVISAVIMSAFGLPVSLSSAVALVGDIMSIVKPELRRPFDVLAQAIGTLERTQTLVEVLSYSPEPWKATRQLANVVRDEIAGTLLESSRQLTAAPANPVKVSGRLKRSTPRRRASRSAPTVGNAARRPRHTSPQEFVKPRRPTQRRRLRYV